MVYDKLKGMIADQLGVSEDEVKPEARLKEDLKADSASVMMLVMDVESEFNIEVEDDAIEKVKTGRKGFHDDVPVEDIQIIKAEEVQA